MAIKVNNWVNDNRKVIAEAGMFKVIEHQKDLSVSKASATNAYYDEVISALKVIRDSRIF